MKPWVDEFRRVFCSSTSDRQTEAEQEKPRAKYVQGDILLPQGSFGRWQLYTVTFKPDSKTPEGKHAKVKVVLAKASEQALKPAWVKYTADDTEYEISRRRAQESRAGEPRRHHAPHAHALSLSPALAHFSLLMGAWATGRSLPRCDGEERQTVERALHHVAATPAGQRNR